MDARALYLEEASDLLRELEVSLLELERKPADAELVGGVFRALHTIKGSGAMCGFDDVASFTHDLETAFDSVREGRVRVTPELIGVTLDARDHIQHLLRGDPLDGAPILARLREIAPAEGDPTPVASLAGLAASVSGAVKTWRIHFEPDKDIFLSGSNPLLLLRELGQLGELRLAAHLDRIPPLENLNPEECYAWWDATLTTAAGEDAIRDVFIFVDDRARIEIQPAADSAPPEPIPESVSPKRKPAETAAATLRVPAAKLDALVDIVGELVTVQARLTSYSQATGQSEVALIAEEVERLTALLRENTMSVRMLPIGETFSRFNRLVRDLSAALGKKVELITEGNDTELDKTVIEQLSDPLVHLIRNSIDHGIEAPARRAQLGKPESGRIRLSACHSGAFVLIRVSDDGAGMNRDAIRARAVERGMIQPDAVLTDEQIFALTLAPGFSTASEVTAVSGRGVGMDVVQRSIDALRGALHITSTPGSGTEVTLKIPLTLAIIDGLLLEAGGEHFVVPVANVCECLELERSTRSRRDSLIQLRGQAIPVIALRDRFSLPGDPPPIQQVIVADTPAGKCGFLVDRVIGDHDTVIKKLGGLYRNVEEISGATILGDGTVALILDVDKMVAEALRESGNTRG